MKLFKVLCKIVGIIIIAVTIIFQINESMNTKVNLKQYTFSHPEIPESFNGYKIMLISDLHNAPFSDMIIKHIKSREPDMLIFAGDIVQLPSDNAKEARKIIKEFKKDIPIYAVSGNHEMQNWGYWEIVNTLKSEGVTWLENKSAYIEKDEEKILLVGLEDPEHDSVSDDKKQEIYEYIKGEIPDEECFSVLLNHRANLYPEICDTGVDLILSGHIHGGIIRLPFIGGVVGQDGEGLFPDYEYGYIKEGNSAAMIVSGGCDKNPKKKRYFNPPEVVLITFESEDE